MTMIDFGLSVVGTPEAVADGVWEHFKRFDVFQKIDSMTNLQVEKQDQA